MTGTLDKMKEYSIEWTDRNQTLTLAMVDNTRNYHLKLSQVDHTWYIDGSTKGKWSSIIPEFQMCTSSCSTF